MAKSFAVVVSLGIGVALGAGTPAPAQAADELLLVNGAHVVGDLQETEFTLTTPMGAHRITRASAWRLVLGTAAGDSVDLRNGNRISGLVEQPGYTLRLPAGQTRVYGRSEIQVVTLGPIERSRFDRRPDVLVLANGDHIYGDLVNTEFEIAMPGGTQRFGRDDIWRAVLSAPSGDTLELKNGDRVTGRIESPAYAIRTPDGQTETYPRDRVLVVGLRVPERPRAAAVTGGPGAVAAVTPPTAPPPVTVPPSALPPAIRAVLRDLHFEFDRWELTPEARGTLEEIAATMRAFPNLSLVIEGHADERGTAEYNLALGAKRAQVARDYLVSLGIEATRLDMVSYGEERPLDAGHSEMAWALNRRAHFAVKAQ